MSATLFEDGRLSSTTLSEADKGDNAVDFWDVPTLVTSLTDLKHRREQQQCCDTALDSNDVSDQTDTGFPCDCELDFKVEDIFSSECLDAFSFMDDEHNFMEDSSFQEDILLTPPNLGKIRDDDEGMSAFSFERSTWRSDEKGSCLNGLHIQNNSHVSQDQSRRKETQIVQQQFPDDPYDHESNMRFNRNVKLSSMEGNITPIVCHRCDSCHVTPCACSIKSENFMSIPSGNEGHMSTAYSSSQTASTRPIFVATSTSSSSELPLLRIPANSISVDRNIPAISLQVSSANSSGAWQKLRDVDLPRPESSSSTANWKGLEKQNTAFPKSSRSSSIPNITFLDESSLLNVPVRPIPPPKTSLQSYRKNVRMTKPKNKPLNDVAVGIMERWYQSHLDHPYPNYEEKDLLARQGSITIAQVNSWFANRRNRSDNTRPKKNRKQLQIKLYQYAKELESASGGVLDACDVSKRLNLIIDEFLT